MYRFDGLKIALLIGLVNGINSSKFLLWSINYALSFVAELKYKPHTPADRPVLGPCESTVADFIPVSMFHNWVMLLDPPV